MWEAALWWLCCSVSWWFLQFVVPEGVDVGSQRRSNSIYFTPAIVDPWLLEECSRACAVDGLVVGVAWFGNDEIILLTAALELLFVLDGRVASGGELGWEEVELEFRCGL